MAHLTTLRQRIKTIATINKTTNAMRLISMSTHAKLKSKQQLLINYKNTLTALYNQTCPFPGDPLPASAAKPTLILISSQKGLCGNFNTLLFQFFEKNKPQNITSYHIITIGKAALDYLLKQHIQPRASYTNINAHNFITTARDILATLITNQSSNAVVISTYGPSFFIQQQRLTHLSIPSQKIESTIPSNDEQSTPALCSYLAQLTCTVRLQELIFDSLLAEQAARFLSMDSSTRNAEKLLETMKLAYNKSRQATITQELSELAASLLS